MRITKRLKRTRPPAALPCQRSVQYLRNFLVAKLIVSNGQRPGAIASLRLSDYDHMKSVPGRIGYHYMLNINHKTTKTHGPAVIIVDRETKRMLRAYVMFRLPESASNVRASHQPLFVAKNETVAGGRKPPRPIAVRVVTDFLNRQCLGHNASRKRVTFTLARKRIVTEGCSYIGEGNDCLAKHMSHSTKTQRAYYMLDTLNEHVKAFKSIEKCLTKTATKRKKMKHTTANNRKHTTANNRKRTTANNRKHSDR